MTNEVKVNIQCKKCNHQWMTHSKYIKVTCPSCSSKTPNPNAELIENEE